MQSKPSTESPANGNEARAEALKFMQQMEARPVHVQHVATLSLQLFDQLTTLHALGSRERLLLELAGYLHDIGHRSDNVGVGHHLESARMIRERRWNGINRAEVEIVAQVARYHRKAMPEMSHEEFQALSFAARHIVQKLGALLRLADALDRTHIQLVREVRVELPVNKIVLHLEITGPVLHEVQAARLKGDLAEAVFQRDLVFMVDGEELMPRE